jgi:hypothetical protein
LCLGQISRTMEKTLWRYSLDQIIYGQYDI